jgi:hypothetical protein
MMFIASYGMLAAFGGTAVVAGFVDTIAGGGGLITVPALLLGGIPPLQALGTNKLQGAFGVLVASISLFPKPGSTKSPLVFHSPWRFWAALWAHFSFNKSMQRHSMS